MKTILKQGWCYLHQFGKISQDDNYTIIVTEWRYFDQERKGYNYWNLHHEVETLEEAEKLVNDLNDEFDLPQYFNPSNSQRFLMGLQERFTKADIFKK